MTSPADALVLPFSASRRLEIRACRRPVVWNPLFLRPGHDMMASRLVCGLRRLAPRQGIASPRRLLCTPAATPPPPPPPLAAEPGMVAHIMKQLGSEVTA